ncbi:MAG: hypothetical protein U0894_13385 [Pirellulales bacterium]
MGLHYAGIFWQAPATTASASEIAETLKLLSDNGIKLAGHGVHGFTKDHEANKKLFDFASRQASRSSPPIQSQTRSIVSTSSWQNTTSASRFTTTAQAPLYDKIASVVKAVEKRHPNVGRVRADCGHFIRTGENPIDAYGPAHASLPHTSRMTWKREPVPRTSSSARDTRTWSASSRLSARSSSRLRFVGMEYEANPENPIAEMKECIEVAKEAIAKSA